jgi:hypothetical protein
MIFADRGEAGRVLAEQVVRQVPSAVGRSGRWGWRCPVGVFRLPNDLAPIWTS